MRARLPVSACIRARVEKGAEADGRLKLLNGHAATAKTIKTFGVPNTHPRNAIASRNVENVDLPIILLQIISVPIRAGKAIQIIIH